MREMQDLMLQIGFSELEIEEVKGFVTQLKAKDLWKNVEQWAEELMSVHPCGRKLEELLNQKSFAIVEKSGLHIYSLQFVMLLQCAVLLKADYERCHIDLLLYYDSMKDLTYKMHECQKVYGVTGTFVGWWYGGFFDRTRFALGRLQFEITNLHLKEAIVVDGCRLEPGDEAINIHIPSSGALREEEAEDALVQAAEFFKQSFEGRKTVFVMHSWLLDEDLIAMLPEGNIKKFVERFSVLRTEKFDTFGDGWRVFGAAWETKQTELPRETRLQRAIAAWLEQGGRLGEGYGVFVRA